MATKENSFRALTDQTYSLTKLSEEVSRLLPHHIPDKPGESDPASKKTNITPRLIRHYQGLGCIDPPAKEGRNAVYNYRHLLQVLLVRKLQGDGLPAANIQEVIKGKDNRYYEDLLEAGATVTLAPSYPDLAENAMNYLEALRTGDGSKAIPFETQMPPATGQAPQVNRWTRIEVLPGLEVHVHDSFRAPNSKREDENILKCIYDTVFRHFHNAPKS